MSNEITEVEDLLEATVNQRGVSELFTVSGALMPLLDAVKQTALEGYDPDVSTAKGRKAIASVAAKLAKARVRLDNIGKDYVAELKELPKTVDANRRVAREYLESLQDELRAPLTAWEAEEQAKQDKAKEEAERLVRQREEERERELADLRAKVEAAEAAERQRKEEEEQAERQRQIEASAIQRAEEAAKAAIEAAERSAQEAEARAKRAEDEAAERAARAAEAARQEEQRRQDDARVKAEREQAELSAGNIARAQDDANRAAVHREILSGLVALGLTQELGKAIVVAMVLGKIKRVRIEY